MKEGEIAMRRRYKLAGMVCACVLACSVTGCEEATEVSDQLQNVLDKEDEHVIGVKNGYPNAIPDITYGEAFESFFGNPTWKYFEADTGEQVVEFTGYCTYQDAEVKARLQFILSEDGKSFETGALSFNDVPQSTFIANAMVYKAFEEYASKHDLDIDEDEDVWTSSEDTLETEADTTTEEVDEVEEVSVTEEKMADKEEKFSMSRVEDMAYYSDLDEVGYGYCLSFTVQGKKILFDVITSTNRYERCGSAKVTGSNKVRCYMEDDRKNYFDVTWDESDEKIHIKYKKKSDYMQSALNGLDLWILDDDSWWFMEEEDTEGDSYILPGSDSCYLTEDDVNWMTSDMLRLARNEIYARHGRIFDSADLNEYFNSQSWYCGIYTAGEFDESWLNQYEKANINLIKSYE